MIGLPLITNSRDLLSLNKNEVMVRIPKFSDSSLLTSFPVTIDNCILFSSGLPYSQGHQMRGFFILSCGYADGKNVICFFSQGFRRTFCSKLMVPSILPFTMASCGLSV